MTNREIDALVAEKVLGYVHVVRMFGNIAIYEWQTPEGVIRQETWQPSKNLAQAWEVLEKFTPHVRIECCDTSDYVEYDADKKWHVDIWVADQAVCCVTAETAPMAICLAALRAHGVVL